MHRNSNNKGKEKGKRRVRKKLKRYLDSDVRVIATVGKSGRAKEGVLRLSEEQKVIRERLLLKDIYLAETSEYICSHTWVVPNREVKRLRLREGDLVGIKARVERYPTDIWVNKKKRYERTTEYGLGNIKEAVLLERGKENKPNWMEIIKSGKQAVLRRMGLLEIPYYEGYLSWFGIASMLYHHLKAV